MKKILTIESIRYLLSKETIQNVVAETGMARHTLDEFLNNENHKPYFESVEKLSDYFVAKFEDMKKHILGEQDV